MPRADVATMKATPAIILNCVCPDALSVRSDIFEVFRCCWQECQSGLPGLLLTSRMQAPVAGDQAALPHHGSPLFGILFRIAVMFQKSFSICFEDWAWFSMFFWNYRTIFDHIHSLLCDFLSGYISFTFRILWWLHCYVLRTCPLCSWSAIQSNQRRSFPWELITNFALSPVHAGIGLWELRGTLCVNLCSEDIINNTQTYAPACSILGLGSEKLLVTLWPCVPHLQEIQESLNKEWFSYPPLTAVQTSAPS